MKTILLVPRLAMFLDGMKFYGLSEVPGVENNPQIVQFFHDLGHTWIQEDETSWCAVFINWLAWKNGCEYTSKLDARSLLKIGKEIKYPQLGHVVVFWREDPSSWKGHTGLYVGEDKKYIYTFGGNQNNQANISPYLKTQWLGYRELNYA
jgi:uncharacterized protein (TIGR02594 family)